MDSENARPTVDTEPPPGVLRRAIAASAIGNATEWFDYGIYAYGVTYISAALFPGDTDERDAAGADDVRASRSWSGRSAGWSGARSATGSAASRCWP